jgi:hypothetical protein
MGTEESTECKTNPNGNFESQFTLLLAQFWACCGMMHKENPPLTLSLKTKIRNIKVPQVEAIPTIFLLLKCMKA